MACSHKQILNWTYSTFHRKYSNLFPTGYPVSGKHKQALKSLVFEWVNFKPEKMLVFIKVSREPYLSDLRNITTSYIIKFKHFGNKYRLLLIHSPVSLYQTCYSVNT